MILRSKLPRVKCFAQGGSFGALDDVLPGINQFSNEVFARLSKHPDFKANLDAGDFEIVEGGNSNQVQNEPPASNNPQNEPPINSNSQSLADHTIAEAIAIAQETENTGLLRRWKELETRAEVVAAIDKKLSEIDAERAAAKQQQGAQSDGLPNS